ncbi:MAG: VanZ family protein [Acidobacteria bacterium]|nr:VanZ family protein [Acidobacteriota bacterium]
MNNTLPRETQHDKLPAFVWWAATIAWSITIFELSTETYGISLSAWLLNEILRILGIHVSAATFHTLHFLLRKLAHLTEYGIFAVLLYGSLGAGREFRWLWRRATVCAAIAGGYALTDELHQLFVPGRTATLHDSALDACGAILALAGLYFYNAVSQAKARRSAANVASPAET